MMICKGSAAAFGVAVVIASSSSWAQDGTGSIEVQGSVTPPPAPPPPAPPPHRSNRAAPASLADEGNSDHEAAVGHLGVGYFGASQIPIGARGANVTAPVIGVRYWLKSSLGIDAGLGFAMASGAVETPTATGSATADKPGRFGVLLHGGLPLALTSGRHYSFQIIPELNLGFASGSQKGNPPTPDTDSSGFRLDLGARVGAEIQFGFIGIPQLALQGSVGLALSMTSGSDKSGASKSANRDTVLATTVQSDPWALFVNNIAALYYF